MKNLNTFNNCAKQHEASTDKLMETLHNGNLEDVLLFVEKGADLTHEFEKKNKFFNSGYHKPLDYLMANCGSKNKNHRKDTFTPKQRIQIFDAFVAKTPNPLDLTSDKTLNIALTRGRAEMISKLANINVKIEDRHFVDAANSIYRPDKTIETMEAVLPYVDYNVNVTNPYSGANAGHIVARHAHLEAFKWLEEHGLDKNVLAKGIYPSTYAYMVVSGSIHIEHDSTERLEFASYLTANGYPIDTPGKEGITPTEHAINNGHVNIACIYIDAEAKVKPEYLSNVINATHYDKATAEDVVTLGEKLTEKDKMNKNTVMLAYRELFHIIAMNNKNMKQAIPIAEHLSFKGITPREAAKWLQSNDTLETSTVFFSPTFIAHTCDQLEQVIERNKTSKTAQITKPPTP